MSREHLWVMQSVQRLIDLKTKHHYYPHGMHYWLHLGFGTPLPYRNHQISSIYISLAQTMSREHLWVMRSVQRLIDFKTKHHYYPHGMHYSLHLGFGTPLPYRNRQISCSSSIISIYIFRSPKKCHVSTYGLCRVFNGL